MHTARPVTCITCPGAGNSDNSTDPRFRLLSASASIRSRCRPCCSHHDDIIDSMLLENHQATRHLGRAGRQVEKPLQNNQIRAVPSWVLRVDIARQKAAITGCRMRNHLGIGLCALEGVTAPRQSDRLYPNRNHSTPGAKSGAREDGHLSEPKRQLVGE